MGERISREVFLDWLRFLAIVGAAGLLYSSTTDQKGRPFFSLPYLTRNLAELNATRLESSGYVTLAGEGYYVEMRDLQNLENNVNMGGQVYNVSSTSQSKSDILWAIMPNRAFIQAEGFELLPRYEDEVFLRLSGIVRAKELFLTGNGTPDVRVSSNFLYIYKVFSALNSPPTPSN